jgi:hypothetical protein
MMTDDYFNIICEKCGQVQKMSALAGIPPFRASKQPVEDAESLGYGS